MKKLKNTILLTLAAQVRSACRRHENGETNCVWDILGEGGGYVGFEEHIEAVLNDRDQELANQDNVDDDFPMNDADMRVIIRRNGWGGSRLGRSDHAYTPIAVFALWQKFCEACHPYENATESDNNSRNCPISRMHTMKLGLRNYGCNCYSDNYDTLYTSQTNAYYGVRGWAHGNNGLPVDDLDTSCHKQHLRMKCVDQDVKDGIFPEIVDAWSWYQQHMQLCDPNFRKPTFDNENRLVYPNCTSDKIHLVDPWLINTYKCGNILHVPWYVDMHGKFYCGNETNPDYVNGVPEGEECLAAVCTNIKQWVDEAFNAIGGCSIDNPREYFEDNVDKYFAYNGILDFDHQNKTKILQGEVNSVFNISIQLDGSTKWRTYDPDRVDFSVGFNCGTGRKQLDCDDKSKTDVYGNLYSDNRTDAIGSIMRGIDSIHDIVYQNTTKYTQEFMRYGFSERTELCWQYGNCDGQWGRHNFDRGLALVPNGRWNGQVYPILNPNRGTGDAWTPNLTRADGYTYPTDDSHPDVQWQYVFNNWRKMIHYRAVDVHEITETNFLNVEHWEKPYSITGDMCIKPPIASAPAAPRQMQCCGDYPHRYPMNAATHVCCDGVVKDLGVGC